jgi:hypothetical protein
MISIVLKKRYRPNRCRSDHGKHASSTIALVVVAVRHVGGSVMDMSRVVDISA